MKTVAVFFGGQSVEHDISIVTALAAVFKPLELSKKYKVEAVYIAKDGTWYWDDKLKDISLYQSGGIDDFMAKAPKVQVQFGEGMTLVKSSQFAGRKAYRKIDVAFPAMHGTNGEDGALMGLLQMAGVPYVGCGLLSSTVSMDKIVSKNLATMAGIPTPQMIHFSKDEYSANMEDIHKQINKSLTYPLFVKPARLGSSIGVTRVDTKKELTNAIEVALHYDSKALVEEGVKNLIEVTVPIVGHKTVVPALVEQPLLQEGESFDFDTKYMGQGKGGKKMGAKMAGAKQGAQGYSRLPADISEQLYKAAEQTALDVWRVLECSGIARVDLLIDEKAKKVYFNEINPLPGSLYAHNFRAAGVSGIELVDKLVVAAEERFKEEHASTTSFNTSFLKQF